jgi:tRNA(Ile)-lysidine synthase
MATDRFNLFLHQKCKVKPGDILLLGVSGGPDSICLLDKLQKAGIELIIAYYNHHLRPESDEDSEFVKQAADFRGLKFIKGGGDVLQFAKKGHKSIEEAARIYRYKFLFEQAIKQGASAVAVGHTADDQVETILMHIIRGCGLEGLQGMQPCIKSEFNQEIFLIRPLLYYWREEVIDYCKKNNLDYREDRSNNDLKFLRNRLRNELIPDLQKYNLNVKEHIFNLGEIVSGDLDNINHISKINFQDCLLNENEDFIVLSLSSLLNLVDGQKRQVIQIAFKKILPSGDEINFDLIEKIIFVLENPNQSKHLELLSNLELSIEGDCILIYKKGAQLPHYKWPHVSQDYIFKAGVPGKWKISPKWNIETENYEISDIRFPEYSGQLILFAFLDADTLDREIIIRTQLSGDRYSPLGIKGKSQKLSDFWINNKVPKRVRSTWPLVLCRDEIIWIPGFQPSFSHRITNETKKAIRMEIAQVNE